MIIGICGFQGSGKDTIANYLIDNYQFQKLSFASALKDIVSIIFGWSRSKLEGVTKEDRLWREEVDEWWSKRLSMENLTPRYVLQMFGTDVFRNHWHKDIWVAIVENQIIKLLEQNKNIVITDCRFENEIAILKSYGAKIIHIDRNLPDWFEKYKSGEYVEQAEKLHKSETEWIRTSNDYLIENNGTIEDLYTSIAHIDEIKKIPIYKKSMSMSDLNYIM